MELSDRIKNARLEAGLSQRQLCGDVITRNMLSLIESGKARPSMDTLRHFSRVLGKPMSYFLEENAVTSPNQEVMQTAEDAYIAGEYEAVLSALEDYRPGDGVFDQTRYLLETLACQALAEQVIAEGKKTYAIHLLDRADAAAANTAYAPDAGMRTLLRWKADPTTVKELRLPITDALLFHADAALQKNNYTRAAQILDAADERPPQWNLLRGMAALGMEDMQTAVTYLTLAEVTYPEKTAPLLEQAYLALGDYKNAYLYAKKV